MELEWEDWVGGQSHRHGSTCQRHSREGTDLLMLLQILWALESLAAFAFVGFERDVHSNMAGDMIPLGGLCVAVSPGTCQTQVVRSLAPNVLVRAVVLQQH